MTKQKYYYVDNALNSLTFIWENSNPFVCLDYKCFKTTLKVVEKYGIAQVIKMGAIIPKKLLLCKCNCWVSDD